MKTYMARLGVFQFGIDTAAFTELQRRSSYRWEAQNRIGRKPAQQMVGVDAETITLSGTIYPHYAGGLSQVQQMRQEAARGEPLPLIYSSEIIGQFLGRWCITSIDEVRRVFFEDGRPRRIDFTITLVEYGEDDNTALPTPVFSGGISPSMMAAAFDAARAAAAAAATVSDEDSVMAAAPKVAKASKSLAEKIGDVINAVKNSKPVTLLHNVAGMASAAEKLIAAGKAIEDADGNPSAMLDALSQAGYAADVTIGAAGKIAGTTEEQRGMANGESASSSYQEQSDNFSRTFRSIESSANRISSSSKTMKAAL